MVTTRPPHQAHATDGWRRRVLLAGGVLVVMLVGAEFVLRALGFAPAPGADADGGFTIESSAPLFVSDAAAGCRYGPGTFVVHYPSGRDVTIHHSSDGLRWTRPPGEASRDSLPQIWIMGGSFTHGWSVDDEHTFPWLVQSALPRHDVRNFGVGGYGTLACWLRFQEALAAGETPVAVVLAYASFHDGRNTWTREWSRSLQPTRRELEEGLPRAVATNDGFRVVRDLPHYHPLPFAAVSALSAALEHLLDRVEDHLHRHSRRVNEAIVRAFQERCRREGIAFVLAGILDDRATRRTLRDCAAAGIDTVDIAVDLLRPGYRNLPDDAHPSRRAHAAYAAALIPHLRKILASSAP